MSVLWMDNFSIYGTDAGRTARLLNGVYAENVSCTLEVDPDGISGGRVLKLPQAYGGGGAYQKLRKVLPANKLTCGQAIRMWLDALPANAQQAPCPISFKDGANNFLYNVVVDSTGRLAVRVGFYGTQIGITTNPVVTANAWQHIEAKCVIDAAVGSFEIRVEGVPVLQLANINTGATPIAQVEVCNDPDATSVGPNMYVKDWIIWDNATAFNNNFMGSCQVYKVVPDADVLLNWTPSPADGIGYDKINETSPDDDARYIMAPFPLPAGPYKCSLTDLPVTVTSVRAVMPIHRTRKIDGGDGNIQAGIVSAASTGLGADRPVTVAYTYWWDVFDSDPNGGIAWTRLSANAMQLQLNRTV